MVSSKITESLSHGNIGPLTTVERIKSAVVALGLGMIIMYGVAFAQGTDGAIHNAVHDTRHSMAFPCH